MENTHEFVQKLNEDKKKQEQNKKRNGNGHPEKKLPNGQHSRG
jgi:Protein of unknown function (DUF4023)